MEEVKKLLLSINNDKPPGSDNLNGKLLRIIADDIDTPICDIFNLSLLESVQSCGQVPQRDLGKLQLAQNRAGP